MIVSDSDEISNDFLTILRDSVCISADYDFLSDSWDELERKQAVMLCAERAVHLEGVRMNMRFKLESVENSYLTRKRALEQKLKDATHENIQRMRGSEIDTVTEWYERKTAEIKHQIERADVYSSLIANGVLCIERV